MIISVVNHSEYTDEYVQEVLRAINRQIAEDFAPYWHRSGELRLEGAFEDEPTPKNPKELRGDAVIYLWDAVSQQADALGFHDLNLRGIPFSIVFTELSEKLGESWTVTLSHEALELLMDPEANLLVEGPHPENSDRTVYHWYEMCDAVQAQSYEIDGVAVANFLLPLYFTGSDEQGSRNDFLGFDDGHGPLASFGVAGGGYVGFYDPELGGHDQYVSPRKNARRRLELRKSAGLTRRTVRRQQETDPERVVRQLHNRGEGDPLPGPWFEAYAVDLRARKGEDPYDVLDAAARAALGADWEERWLAVEPTYPRRASDVVTYELVPKQPVPASEAWERSYALRAQRGIADVEPDFVIFRADSEILDSLPPGRRMFLFGAKHLPGSERCEWSVEQVRAREAWAHAQGERITVGHPDTGFLPHPEIWPEAGGGPIDTTRDWDFVDDEDDAHAEPGEDDVLPGGPNHGTSTASVLVGAAGPTSGATASGADGKPASFVTGIAPKATLVPLRVSNSVVHFSMRRLRKAIEYATRWRFHVLSMSLGGPFPSRHLHAAIRDAVEGGVIPIAAAGNSIPFRPVIWPARYPEVVAVAACNVEKRPWSGSSRGDAIDITAPGESVWRALVDTDARGKGRYLVERSSGTSYATAITAGVCALWLSHHGWRKLYDEYGGQLADAFRTVLARTAQKSDHLDGDEFGPGIVDAEKLLLEPLPSRQEVSRASASGRSRRALRARSRGSVDPPLAAIEALFPQLSAAEVRRGLEALLGSDARGLSRHVKEVADELVFQFATDPSLCRRFAASCRRAAGASRSRAALKWRAAACEDLRIHIRRSASSRLGKALG